MFNRKIAQSDLLCLDCGKHSGMYILKQEIWSLIASAHERKRWICISCAEKRLGRLIMLSDFRDDSPINDVIRHAFEMGRRGA